MIVKPLQKKLYVEACDQGSVVNKTNNWCYYLCIKQGIFHLYNIEIDILKFRNYVTSDLPFTNILDEFDSIYNPRVFGAPADHRVIQNTIDKSKNILGIKFNIYLLHAGTHLYKFGNYSDKLNPPICLFLNKGHYFYVQSNLYRIRMIDVFKSPNLIFPIPQSEQKKRKNRRGKRDKKVDNSWAMVLSKSLIQDEEIIRKVPNKFNNYPWNLKGKYKSENYLVNLVKQWIIFKYFNNNSCVIYEHSQIYPDNYLRSLFGFSLAVNVSLFFKQLPYMIRKMYNLERLTP